MEDLARKKEKMERYLEDSAALFLVLGMAFLTPFITLFWKGLSILPARRILPKRTWF